MMQLGVGAWRGGTCDDLKNQLLLIVSFLVRNWMHVTKIILVILFCLFNAERGTRDRPDPIVVGAVRVLRLIVGSPCPHFFPATQTISGPSSSNVR
jgi:hypothetical protein